MRKEPGRLKVLSSNLRGYARDVDAYVQPWNWGLGEIRLPVLVWHGAQDNWSPLAMADHFRSALPQCSWVQMMEKQSQYGCLLKAARLICATSAEHSTRLLQTGRS
jgi:pimeloyl-ACP methyl ester carboxylesterase